MVGGDLLRALSFSGISVEALTWFGALATYGLRGKPLKRASAFSMKTTVDLLGAGFELASDWRRFPDKPNVFKLFRCAFPNLLPLVNRLPEPLWRLRILEALNAYAIGTRSTEWPIIGREKFLTAVGTQKAIATDLGIRTERLEMLLEQVNEPKIAKRITTKGRSRRFISGATLTSVKMQLADRLSVKQAALLLGIASRRVIQLIDHGMLRRVGMSLRRQQINCFYDYLRKNRDDHFVDWATKVMTVGEALRRWVPVVRTPSFFEAISSDDILVVSSNSTPILGKWAIEESSLLVWHHAKTVGSIEYLSIPEAGIRLKVKEQVAYDLVNRGLLKTSVQMLRQRQARTVSTLEVDRFSKSYVPLSVLAARHGVSSKQSFAWSASQKMRLATGPVVDGSR